MIRYTLVSLIVAVLSVHAFKDWYKSLCGLIVLAGIFQHPDIRGPMLGIQGLNLWNILLVFVLLGWMFNRGQEGLVWSMPRRLQLLLFVYLSIIISSFIRMLDNQVAIAHYAEMSNLRVPTSAYLWSEHLINALKWVVPGILLFDGCRSRSRFILGISALLLFYFVLAVQVIKWMPLGAIASGNELSYRASKILLNEVGFSRVNLSTLFAGASWGFFSAVALQRRALHAMAIFSMGVIVLFAQLLTAGRAGYAAWVAVGLVLSMIRWRKYLVIIPAVVMLLLVAVPEVMQRVEQGFVQGERPIDPAVQYAVNLTPNEPDLYKVSSGRNIAWPYVIEKIEESPFLGYGGLAMQALGISAQLQQTYMEDFSHPHNAYLEFLLDNGLIGFIPVMLFYLTILMIGISLLRDSRSAVFISIGGVAFSIVGTFLVASMGSQTFYPREGALGMWCAVGLLLRVFVERSRVVAQVKGASSIPVDDLLWGK